MTQAGTTARQILLDCRDVAMRPWRAFTGRAGLRDRVLWQDPAGKTYRAGRAGCVLFYLYLHQAGANPTRERMVPPTADQQAWAETTIAGG